MPRLLDETFPQESARVQAVLTQITSGLDSEAIDQLERVAASVPDTATAFNYLLRLREAQPDAFYRIVVSRTALQFLLTAFAHSHFLSEELLQNPFWVEDLAARDDLHRVCRVDEYRERLRTSLESRGGHPDAVSLASFRRESILRILLRDVLGFGTLPDITEELSTLADAMLEVTYLSIREDLVRRYGRPMETCGGETKESGFAVIALGKLGGGELNYSSDIDL